MFSYPYVFKHDADGRGYVCNAWCVPASSQQSGVRSTWLGGSISPKEAS